MKKKKLNIIDEYFQFSLFFLHHYLRIFPFSLTSHFNKRNEFFVVKLFNLMGITEILYTFLIKRHYFTRWIELLIDVYNLNENNLMGKSFFKKKKVGQ